MITLKVLREFISGMSDDTKIGIDDDQVCLVFREPGSSGEESPLESGRLDAHGAYPEEEGYENKVEMRLPLIKSCETPHDKNTGY